MSDINKEYPELLQRISSLKEKINKLEEIVGRQYPKYDGEKIVVYSANRIEYKDIERSLKTLITNSPVDKVYIFAEDDEVPFQLPSFAEVVNYSNQKIFPSYIPWKEVGASISGLIKLALHSLLSQHKRVLYLKPATLILGDLSELFTLPMGDWYLFGAVEENRHYVEANDVRKPSNKLSLYKAPSLKKEPYYNCEVLLMNLEELRNSGVGNALIERANNYYTFRPDSTAINILSKDRVFPVSSVYNWSYNTCEDHYPKIVQLLDPEDHSELAGVIKLYDMIPLSEIVTWREGDRDDANS